LPDEVSSALGKTPALVQQRFNQQHFASSAGSAGG
jgi:hypothetical protein